MFTHHSFLKIKSSTEYIETFKVHNHTYMSKTIEIEIDGHVSWSCTIMDQSSNNVMTLEYDNDTSEWISSYDGHMYYIKTTNPAYAAKSMLSESYH